MEDTSSDALAPAPSEGAVEGAAPAQTSVEPAVAPIPEGKAEADPISAMHKRAEAAILRSRSLSQCIDPTPLIRLEMERPINIAFSRAKLPAYPNNIEHREYQI